MSFELTEVRAGSRKPGRIAGLVVAGLVLVGCSGDKGQPAPSTQEVSTTAVPTTTHEVATTTVPPTTAVVEHNVFIPKEGCKPFTIFVQDRFEPLGAAARTEPFPDAQYKLASGYPGRDADNNPLVLTVDGWVDTGKSPFPDNPAPFNRGVYYHVIKDALGISDNQEVYASYAGVRGEATSPAPDATSADRGLPAPLDTACEGTFQQ